MITTTKIAQLFQKITEENIFLKKFIHCRLEDFNAEANKLYPMLFLEMDYKYDYTLQGRQSFRTISFGFFLLSNFTKIADSNEQYLKEVSSLEQIGQSILQYLYFKVPSTFAQVETKSSAMDYLRIFSDDTIALRYDISLKAPFSINTCDAYFNEPFNTNNYEPC